MAAVWCACCEMLSVFVVVFKSVVRMPRHFTNLTKSPKLFSKPWNVICRWHDSNITCCAWILYQAVELTVNILCRKLCKNWSTSRCRLPTLQSHAAVRGPWAVRDQDQPRHQAFSSPGTPAPSPLQPGTPTPSPRRGTLSLSIKMLPRVTNFQNDS